MTDDTPYEVGLRIRREVLGDEHVDRSLARASEFAQPMQKFVTEHCWGAIWSREGLNRRERSLVNLGILTALNRSHELQLHVRARCGTAAPRQEIQEVLLQAAIYCGVPAAMEGFRVAEAALAELDREAEALDGSNDDGAARTRLRDRGCADRLRRPRRDGRPARRGAARRRARLDVFDTRADAAEPLVARGARLLLDGGRGRGRRGDRPGQPAHTRRRPGGAARAPAAWSRGSAIRTFVDLSTTGPADGGGAGGGARGHRRRVRRRPGQRRASRGRTRGRSPSWPRATTPRSPGEAAARDVRRERVPRRPRSRVRGRSRSS